MAQADLGFFYWNMGQTDLGMVHTLKVDELRDRVSDRERRFILFLYDRQVTGNLQKESETIEAWAQAYRHDWQAWVVLSGWGRRGMGHMNGQFKRPKRPFDWSPITVSRRRAGGPQYVPWTVPEAALA